MDWMSKDSYWHAAAVADDSPQFAPLVGEAAADVVVVGAGITGLTTALLLQSDGMRVVVLEAGRIGAGTTGGTSGHLDATPDQGAARLIRQFGEPSAQAVTAGRLAAIGRIESWCRELAIDCDFQRIPAFLYSESDKGAKDLEEERGALSRLGLQVVSEPSIGLPFPNAGGLRLADHARFHPLRYLQGLARAFCDRGGVNYEHSPAQPPHKQHSDTIRTDRGRVTATRSVLLCTHSPFLGVSQFDARVAPYQSYVLTARVAEQIPDALFWDDAEPYHYLRLAATGDPHLILVGGADHKTGQGGDERESMRQLEDYVRQRFTVQAIEQRWSSEFYEPDDGLPYVGAVPGAGRLFMATGYSGTGLTFGTLAGMLLSDLVQGRDNSLEAVFSPGRLKPLAAAKRFVSENVNVAQRFVGDRLTTDSVRSLEEIRPGEGRVVRYRGQALAAYRSDEGQLTTLSPACTHAGCFVQWNEQEHTWDCPCHGGRYSPTGERLYGPPPRNLDPAESAQSRT